MLRVVQETKVYSNCSGKKENSLSYLTGSSMISCDFGYDKIQVPRIARNLPLSYSKLIISWLASFSLKIFPPGSKMIAAGLYRASLASSGASKLLFCCGNRKFPGIILLGLAWIPCLFHICS